MSLPQHPLSAAFPSMSPQELSDLTDDIALHGLRQPVVTLNGQVLDGWHRYQACAHAEVNPTLVEYDGDDPAAFVISSNTHRRHLTATQRAAAVVLANAWKPSGNQPKGEAASPPLSNAEMAVQAKTTVRTIQHAKRGVEAGKGKAMRDGKISAEAAAKPKKSTKPASSPEPERTYEAEPLQPDADLAERFEDMATEYETLLRTTSADVPLTEALLIIKELRAKYDSLDRQFNAKCEELRTMTREAKRHQRRAEALDPKRKGA